MPLSPQQLCPLARTSFILQAFLPSANLPKCPILWFPCASHTHTLPCPVSLVALLGLKGLPLTVFLVQYHTARSQMFTKSIESFMHSLQESRLGWRRQCTRQMGAVFSQSWKAGEILNNPAAVPMGTVKGQSRVLRKGLRGLSLFQGTRQDSPQMLRPLNQMVRSLICW